MYGCGKDCLILILLRPSQISFLTLSLKCFSSDSGNCPDVEIRPLLQFPLPPRAGPVLLTLVFPPSSFVLPSFAWLCILFSSGQVLLSTLSWCSMSEGVFPMCPWREMYSTSTHSSAVLYSPSDHSILNCNPFPFIYWFFVYCLCLYFVLSLQFWHALKCLSKY